MQAPKFIESYPKLFNIFLNDNNYKKEFYKKICRYPGGASRIENLILNGEIDPYNDSYINEISKNPNAFYIIKDYIIKNKDKYNSYIENPSAIDLINTDDINIYSYLFLKNPHPKVIKIIEDKLNIIEEIDNINIIKGLLLNPNALSIIEKFVDKNLDNEYMWKILSYNPLIINLLKKYNDPKIIRLLDWYKISQIPEAIDIINENKSFVDWRGFAKNPAAIDISVRITFYHSLNPHPKMLECLNNLEYYDDLPIYLNNGLLVEYCKIDYNKMKQIMSPVFEEICQKVFNPERLERLSCIYWNRYGFEMIDSAEIYNGDIYNTIDYYYKRTEELKSFRNELIVNSILFSYPNILIY